MTKEHVCRYLEFSAADGKFYCGGCGAGYKAVPADEPPGDCVHCKGTGSSAAWAPQGD